MRSIVPRGPFSPFFAIDLANNLLPLVGNNQFGNLSDRIFQGFLLLGIICNKWPIAFYFVFHSTQNPSSLTTWVNAQLIKQVDRGIVESIGVMNQEQYRIQGSLPIGIEAKGGSLVAPVI